MGEYSVTANGLIVYAGVEVNAAAAEMHGVGTRCRLCGERLDKRWSAELDDWQLAEAVAVGVDPAGEDEGKGLVSGAEQMAMAAEEAANAADLAAAAAEAADDEDFDELGDGMDEDATNGPTRSRGYYLVERGVYHIRCWEQRS